MWDLGRRGRAGQGQMGRWFRGGDDTWAPIREAGTPGGEEAGTLGEWAQRVVSDGPTETQAGKPGGRDGAVQSRRSCGGRREVSEGGAGSAFPPV